MVGEGQKVHVSFRPVAVKDKEGERDGSQIGKITRKIKGKKNRSIRQGLRI